MKKLLIACMVLLVSCGKPSPQVKVTITPVSIDKTQSCYKTCITYYSVTTSNLEVYELGADSRGSQRSKVFANLLNKPQCAIIQDDYIVKLCNEAK